MDHKKVFKRKGQNIFRVDRIFNLKFSNIILSPEYSLIPEDSKLSETGLLIIFRLEPLKDFTLPFFSVRLDEHAKTVDVDIKNVKNKISSYFKYGKNNYSGHHSKRISKTSLMYYIQIKIPQLDVFSGEITFNTNHGHLPGLFSSGQPVSATLEL